MADSTLAQIGSQVTLAYWGGASPAVWSNLAPIRSISGIGKTRAEIDSTTLDSLAIERISSLPDGKSVSIVLTTGSAILPIIEGFINNGTPVDFRVTFPAPTSLSRYFTLVPLDFDMGSITPTGLLEITLVGRITGAIASVATH